ncbi:F-box domain-containing protein [Mycena venus]|uniref:F-box domain-containing protein n=1 Tax=Mycena venus TaxID=2733690 RepID=A0A8H7D698_9AGAR|nr:F-box domain-containing protein [Mycena venus]
MNSQPEEILREIFIKCLDTRYPHVQPFLPTEAPLLLCGVCVLWRAIAITTSELWAHLSVSIGREASEKPQPSPELIRTWIARSGCQPLTLVLKDSGQGSSGADMANHILELLLPHIHRWQSITLTLPNHAFPTKLIGLDSGASQLQIANLEFSSDPALHAADTPQVAGLARILASSSQLHTLYWHNDPCTLRFVEIPWGHLTVIDLVPVWSPMSQILHLMERAPKLRSLSTFITEACPVVRSLSLPDLVILWVAVDIDIGPFFKRLNVPSLQNINVFCASQLPRIPQTDVVHCIARSGSPLHTAIFKSLHISNSDLIEFLRRSPSLLLFEISNDGEPTVTDEILRLLTAGEDPCLCPSLRIIRFLESSISSTDGLLADMVASRRTRRKAVPVALLSRFVVDFSEADSLKHAEDIGRLRILGEAADFRTWINEPETA